MQYLYYKTLFLAYIPLLLSCERGLIEDAYLHTLPVFKLTIDEKHLFSPDSGLYIIGNKGAFSCNHIANYNQKWEYPAKVQFYENGKKQFTDTVGLRIKGNCSRQNAMKSLGLYWRKTEYGKKDLDYQLFPDIETQKFKRLVLRNSGNDFGKTHIKDATITNIFKEYANVDYQEYRPTVVYINEEYWGIHNMREMITPHHFKYHYGVDEDNIDLLEGSELTPIADDGTTELYISEVVDYLKNNDLSQNTTYESFQNIIDIESYIDYIIVNTYTAKWDWPCGNAKWWKDKTSTRYTNWRWVIYDNDWGFDMRKVDDVWIGDLYGSYFGVGCENGFYIFNALIKNNHFRTTFLDRYLFFLNKVFEEQRVKNIIHETKRGIQNEYDNHQCKWGTLPQTQWEKEVDDLITFNNERNKIMRDIIYTLQNEQ